MIVYEKDFIRYNLCRFHYVRSYSDMGVIYMGIKKFLSSVLTAGMILTFIPSVSMADSTGWKGSNTSGWRYYISDTEYVRNAWRFLQGKWYYFDNDGYVLMNCWKVIKGKLYHFDVTGAMEQNKWISEGTYLLPEYYDENIELNPDYEQVYKEYRNRKIWRYVGDDGAAYVGWKKVDGEWYHFNDEDITLTDIGENHQDAYAAMTYGFYYDETDKTWYNFDGDGKYRRNGWYYGPGEYEYTEWYYFGNDGHPYSGWHKIDNKWYYFALDNLIDFAEQKYGPACIVTGRRDFYNSYDDDGYAVDWDVYFFRESGSMVTGWFLYEDHWYCMKSDGSAYRDCWLEYKGKWYYFNRGGEMVSNAVNFEAGGKGYDFDSKGVCTNPYGGRKISGWYERKYDSEYYFWYDSDYAWNYFDASGKKVCGVKDYVIGGQAYDFDSLGVCMNPYEPHAVG